MSLNLKIPTGTIKKVKFKNKKGKRVMFDAETAPPDIVQALYRTILFLITYAYPCTEWLERKNANIQEPAFMSVGMMSKATIEPYK